ncbi:MAG: hypothetical protein OSB05_03555 [Akkermansiaceae bacterium]|nr:hypothetical protein [Akkermansiaceae bacterium]
MKFFPKTILAGIGSMVIQLVYSDETVVKEILPSEVESAWQRIAWKTDLWEAREEAARTGKPIYLWEMDGHPLGCV